MGYDSALYRYLTDHPSAFSFLEPAASVLNRLGKGDALGFLCVLLLLAGYFYGRGRWVKIAGAGLASVLISGVAVQALKHLFGRARPQMNLDGAFFGPNLAANGFDSFPSGHTMSCFTLAAFFAGFFPKARWFFYGFAASVAVVGRVVFRHHFPTDVLAGAVFGIFLGRWIASKASHWIESEPASPAQSSAPAADLKDGSTAKNLIILLLFSAAALLPGLSQSGLWDRDETEYAQAGIEMQQRNSWLVPTLEGEPFLEKPILMYGFLRSSYELLGVSELSSRLPSALFGIATCLATYFLAEACWAGTGLYAGLVLASSFLFVGGNRLLMTDPLFVFLNVLSLWGYVRSRAPGNGKSRLAFSYAAMGLAVLTKGPFGMFPACVFVLFEGLQMRSFGRWLKESVLRHAAFSLISVLIAAPWFLYTFSIQRGATENFFFYDNLLRVLKGSEGHTGPLSYYLPVLLGGLLPWSFFFFPLVGEEWKNRKRGVWTMDPEFFLLALWACSLFVFFSVTANKLPHYMLPVVPAAACLLGRFWRDRIQGTSSGSDLPLKWTSGLLILLTLAPAALYFVRPQYASLRLSAPFLVLTLFVMFARYLAARGDWRRSFLTVCFGTILFLTILFHAALPWVEQFRVMKPIGLAIREQVPAQARLAGYRVSEPSLFIYGGRTFPKLEGERLNILLSSPDPTYIVTTESLLNAESGNAPHRVLARAEGFAENGGETTIVLVTNAGEAR